ncbi:MAG: response regulator [Chitinivibrionales bacterium]|nr:response regulator [Chitinivibrionales bacterium]
MAYNVLLVDDSVTVREVIARTLALADIPLGAVYHAANGVEALEMLEKSWIDVVFADLNMPLMNGIELVERMSQAGLMATIPVVIVSTDGSITRVEELKAKGVSAYVRKPFTPELLRGVVEQVLGRTDEQEKGSDER